MGYKSKSIQKNNNFKIRGLIFDCEEDYLIYKNIDKNIKEIVKSVNDGKIKLKDVFKNVKRINVKETYYDASDELDAIFRNVTELLCYEGTIFENDYKVAYCFFERINVIDYYSSDSDSDSDSDSE